MSGMTIGTELPGESATTEPNPELPSDVGFAQRFLDIATPLLAEAGLDNEASAEDHPRHSEYLALIRRAWDEAAASW